MMDNYLLLTIVVGCAIFLVGTIFTAYQLYTLVSADAHCRNIPNPKMWGTLSLSGNNTSGLILYLIKRRNYPIVSQSETQKEQMNSYKTKCGIGIAFIAIGAIVAIWGFALWKF